jgi:hypothetical protein
MAINTSTFLVLKGLLDESLGDSLEFDTTTTITTNTSIVSTALKAYDKGRNGYFDNWWVEITEGVNAGVKRLTGSTAYVASSGTLTVYGAALGAEAGAVTCRLHRYDPTKKENSIKRAVEEIYPSLHKKVDDMTLIMGNILPDAHFESWTSTSALTHYSTSNATLAKTSTVTLIRGGTYSAKVTATVANGCFYIDSGMYPRLLDLKGKTVDFYTWAISEVTDDAWIKIETYSIDGTTSQSLTSTTPCVASVPTLLKLESQTLNENLYRISISWGVTTNAKYVYFDDAYLSGMRLSEYLLPPDFISGSLRQVWLQTNGESEPAFYDLHPFNTQYTGVMLPFTITDNGVNRYLQFFNDYLSGYRLRLIGDKPLETLSAVTDTLTLDTEKLPLLIAKARKVFWQRAGTAVSAEDRDRFKNEANEAENEYRRLLVQHGMPRAFELVHRYDPQYSVNRGF